jgi:hypothetical protein
MSTEERWDHDIAKCPCQQGTIREYVASPDNSYSPTQRTVTINCDKCSQEWELSGKTLTLKSSTREAEQIRRQLSGIERQIRRIKDEVLYGYFARMGIKTMKGEWEEMTRLGFYKESLATFRNRRGSTATPTVYQFAGLEVDEGWLMKEASITNAKDRLEEQHKQESKTKLALREASAKIVRKKISELDHIA